MDSYVTCHLMGGLGNQMFQVATTMAYGIDHSMKYLFPTDTDQGATRKNSYKDTVLKFIPRMVAKNIPMYKEPHHYFDPIPAIKQSFKLFGYFQSWKYFHNHRQKLYDTFISQDLIHDLSKEYNFENSIAIHVRRGDYVGLSQIHHNLPLSYYEAAIKEIGDYDRCYIFSDDIEWCKSNPIFINMEKPIFVEQPDHICLHMMTLCSKHIIANSSFSWWGAYLSESTEVVCPQTWFGPKGPQFKITDIALPEWKIL